MELLPYGRPCARYLHCSGMDSYYYSAGEPSYPVGNTQYSSSFLSKQKVTGVVMEDQLSSSLHEAHDFKGGSHFLSEE